ncbi:MAG: elongation factor G, partial [Gemmatimonadota bacterium]
QVVELKGDDDGPLAALIFKTASEPHVGELSLFRIVSGHVKTGATVLNAGRGGTEKLAHLAVMQGKDRLEIDALHAGDLGVTTKLRGTHTNDTLCAPDRPVIVDPIAFPEPDVAQALRAATRGDEEKISVGLQKLHEEDPTFIWAHDAELGQTIARGLGELHLKVAVERLKRKHGLEVVTEQPRIPYRETIRKKAEGQGRYKKQTGGRGQYGDCWVRLVPLPRGSGYEFEDAIVGGSIPGKFVPSVGKGIQEAAQRGIVAGYPVVDFRAECYDGSYHSVDSSDIAFKIAGSLAFQNVAAQADPVLLEPIYEVTVSTPEETMGDVIGDLNQRRGRILGMEPDGRRQKVRALVPLAELHNYATALRSITHGRATHTKTFHSYEDVPAHTAERIIEEAKKAREAS